MLRVSSRGQVSFEFVVVIAAVFILVAVIMADFFDESSDVFVYNSVKDVTFQEISALVLSDPACSNTRLISMSASASTSGGTITLKFGGCQLNITDVANTIERDFCGIKTPDSNQQIRCGDKVYNLVVT